MAGKLYIVPTPVGNLDDMTPRAIAVFTVGTKHLCHLLQRFHQSHWRFVENHGARLGGKRLQSRCTAFFLRQEALEGEALARQTRIDQRWHERLVVEGKAPEATVKVDKYAKFKQKHINQLKNNEL